MDTGAPLKRNYARKITLHKLKEILLKYSGQDWKTLAFPVLLIYWVIIITATFSL
jgi:hypothetical protein